MMRPEHECAVALAGVHGAGRTLQQQQVDSQNTVDAALPQQFRNRRAFVVWAVSAGFASPNRLTEAVVAEIEAAES